MRMIIKCLAKAIVPLSYHQYKRENHCCIRSIIINRRKQKDGKPLLHYEIIIRTRWKTIGAWWWWSSSSSCTNGFPSSSEEEEEGEGEEEEKKGTPLLHYDHHYQHHQHHHHRYHQMENNCCIIPVVPIGTHLSRRTKNKLIIIIRTSHCCFVTIIIRTRGKSIATLWWPSLKQKGKPVFHYEDDHQIYCNKTYVHYDHHHYKRENHFCIRINIINITRGKSITRIAIRTRGAIRRRGKPISALCSSPSEEEEEKEEEGKPLLHYTSRNN